MIYGLSFDVLSQNLCSDFTVSNTLKLTCQVNTTTSQEYITQIFIDDSYTFTDHGEPDVINQLVFTNLKYILFGSTKVKNPTYNLLSLLDNSENKLLNNIGLNGLDVYIPNKFPNFINLNTITLNNNLIKSNVSNSIFRSPMRSFYFNQIKFDPNCYLNFDTTLVSPITEVTLSNIYANFQSPWNSNLSIITLGNCEFSITDFSVFPKLNTLSLKNVNTLLPIQSWFKNSSGGTILIDDDNLSGVLGDIGVVQPKSIAIFGTPSVTTQLYPSYCNTILTLKNVTLSPATVPDCFYCYWSQTNSTLPSQIPPPQPGFICNISLNSLTYTVNKSLNYFDIFGTNLGYGLDVVPSDKLSVVIPNKQFRYTYPTPYGSTVITFSSQFQSQFSIKWGSETVANYAQSFPSGSETKITVHGTFPSGEWNYVVKANGATPSYSRNETTIDITLQSSTTEPVLIEISTEIVTLTLYSAFEFKIKSISNITSNGGNVDIEGNFGQNPYQVSALAKGNSSDTFSCTFVSINSTVYICTIKGPIKYASLDMLVSANGYTAGVNLTVNKVVVPPLDDCGTDSKCNGNGQCVSGRCQCYRNFNGYYCESAIDTGVKITPNEKQPAPTIVTKEGLGFKFNIIAIQELNSQEMVVNEINTTQWNYNVDVKQNLTTHQYLLANQNPGATHAVRALIDHSTSDRTVEFAGETTMYPANTLKLSIEVSNWNYSDRLNHLRVVMVTQIAMMAPPTGCESTAPKQDIGTDDKSNIKFIKLTINDRSFYGRFLSVGLADKTPVTAINEIISNNDNYTDTVIGISIPYCTECVVDPDFSVLLNTGEDNSGQGCNGGSSKARPSKTMMIAIIVSVVGAIMIATIVAVVLYYKKKEKIRFLMFNLTNKSKMRETSRKYSKQTIKLKMKLCIILLYLIITRTDEFFDRPTEPLSAWVLNNDYNNSNNNNNNNNIKIYGGRDLKQGGSWLGINTKGQFAVVLNYRSIKNIVEPIYPKSRGSVIEDYLLSGETPQQYLTKLKEEIDQYGPFNVFVGDVNTGVCLYLCNSATNDISNDIIELKKGVLYGISNGFIDHKWPKVSRGLHLLKELKLNELIPNGIPDKHSYETLFKLMADNEKSYESLTNIYPKEIEHKLSSIYVDEITIAGRTYGTRTTSIIIVDQQNNVYMSEIDRQENKVYNIQFEIDIN
ncbi:hypothetical protein PPL_06296 [Heterostelium album PN500]|uniref:EGF-like domain-containing protein n=1 Tax=Heterostelium pallidum (strain ATCC 26659 / Pp 5 / PN500) TaxID=670386 RepID=D3BCR8_HETP5|nr:hypothetical protein PPL_06296 [Heterostelium album PN500]EFA80710.1 hypothetical protein PPL_06296 [Heterostelium album PN500]|eukprot:XP_020432830.1 hypothetical protein PPL_06296 [Heterostelium album PN500]